MVSAVGLVPTPGVELAVGVVMVVAMEGAVIEYLRSITQYNADPKKRRSASRFRDGQSQRYAA
jgi:hypothetical protein